MCIKSYQIIWYIIICNWISIYHTSIVYQIVSHTWYLPYLRLPNFITIKIYLPNYICPMMTYMMMIIMSALWLLISVFLIKLVIFAKFSLLATNWLQTLHILFIYLPHGLVFLFIFCIYLHLFHYELNFMQIYCVSIKSLL